MNLSSGPLTLEAVQHKAARFVCNDFSSYSSMTAMMNNLKWNSLEDRRKQARLIMFYKLIHGMVQVNFNGTLLEELLDIIRIIDIF